MDNCASAKVPMNFGHKLTADELGEPADLKTYRSMIGSLLYLTTSRPDIMYSTCLCARYQAAPKASHVQAVKQIFRYLRGTKNLGIWYPAGNSSKNDFMLQAYSDSSYGGTKLERQSTSGGCQFLGNRLVSWSSRKQSCIALSTGEAEYIAAASCTSQVLWMKSQLLDYGYRYQQVPIYCDSQSAIAMAHNTIQHSMSKHIDIRYHFIKDHILKGDVELIFVHSDQEIADVFTKPLDETAFVRFLRMLGMFQPDSEFFKNT